MEELSMVTQKTSRPPSVISALVAILTVAQVGGTGILIYFIINEWILGRGSGGTMIWFYVLLLGIVDLFLLYWLTQFLDQLARDEAS